MTTGQRVLAWIAATLLFGAMSVYLFGATFDGDRLFVPMHTAEFLPWVDDLDPAELAALEEGSNTPASDKLISFRADDAVTVAAMRAEELPLWNPYNAGGVPHLGQGLYGVFYPFHAIYRWLDPEQAYGILAAIHHLLAALFTYLYLRQIGAGPAGATLGGLAFGFSTCLLARTHYYQYLETFAWLPLGLLLVERWFVRGSRTALFLLAPVCALVLLSGWPQTAVFTIYAWVFLALMHSMRSELRVATHRVIGSACAAAAVCAALSYGVADPLLLIAFGPFLALLLIILTGDDRAAFVRRMAALGALLAIGGGIAMLQYLPAAEWSKYGVRSIGTPEDLVRISLRPRFLIELLLPGVFGDPTHMITPMMYNLPQVFALSTQELLTGWLERLGNSIENAVHFGVVPALLMPFGLLLATPRRGFLTVTMLFYGAFALGVTYVVYPAFFSGFFIGSDSRRALPVAVFAACCLAGAGWSELARRPRVVVALSLVTLSGALGALWLAFRAGDSTLLRPLLDRAAEVAVAAAQPLDVPQGTLAQNAETVRDSLRQAGLTLAAATVALWVTWKKPRVGSALMIGAVAASLAVAARPHLHPKPAAGFLGTHPLIEHLRAEVGTTGRIAHYIDQDSEQLSVRRIVLPPNLSANFGLLDAMCYTVSPPRRWNQLAMSALAGESGDLPNPTGVFVEPLRRPEHLASRVLDVMSVKAILGTGALPDPLPDGVRLDRQFGSCWILRNDRALPRVHVVGDVEDANDYSPTKIVMSRLRAENFDPRRRVLLEGEAIPDDRLFDRDHLPTATLVEDQRERLRISLEGGESGGVLVIQDGFAPGWRAAVDGVETEVMIANYAMRAVAFPKGAREVVLRYDPNSVRYGKVISAASAGLAGLLLLIGMMADLVRGRRGRSDDNPDAPPEDDPATPDVA